MGRLENKIAIITGAATGIGAASALLFAKEGAKVAVVTRRNVEAGQKVVREIEKAGGEAFFIQADVAKHDDARGMIEETVRRYGRLDILFNNAGISTTTLLHEMTTEEYDKVMDVNVRGVFFACKYAVIQMKKQGKGVILTNGSKASLVSGGCKPVYCASKGAVLQMMQAMALDYAADNIRVNSLLPGSIETPMADFVIDNQKNPREFRHELEIAQPIQRLGTSEECANAALFLVSDEASYITGTYILVDGGFCAQ